MTTLLARLSAATTEARALRVEATRTPYRAFAHPHDREAFAAAEDWADMAFHAETEVDIALATLQREAAKTRRGEWRA